jgi:ribose-phosphate pyrophosphokinase
MFVKVIDSDNYAASGIETFFFPGGEPHARIPKDFGDALLYLKPRTWNDVGLALAVLNALYYQNEDSQIWLFSPYFPGARQDRTDGQTPWTINMMVDCISQFVDRAYTFDAHSDYTIDIIKGSGGKNFMPSDLMVTCDYPDYIIIPDAGALERCKDFAKNQFKGLEYIQCEKKRDFATGKFIGFTMPRLPGIGHYLIVDDICDGGGTFNLLAEEFLKDPYGEFSALELWVSHGIFSKGLSALHPKISKIYTTDSWCKLGWSERLQVLLLEPIVDQILKEYENV